MYDFDDLEKDYPLDSNGDGNYNIFSPAILNSADECLEIFHHRYTNKNALTGNKSTSATIHVRNVNFSDKGKEASSSLKADFSSVGNVPISKPTKKVVVMDHAVERHLDYDWFVGDLRCDEHLHDLRAKFLRSRERKAIRKISSFFSDRRRKRYNNEKCLAKESVTNYLASRESTRGGVGSSGVEVRSSTPFSRGHSPFPVTANSRDFNGEESESNSHFVSHFFNRKRIDSIGGDTVLSVVTFDDERSSTDDSRAVYKPSNPKNQTDLSKWQAKASATLRKEKKEIESRRCDRGFDIVMSPSKTKLSGLFSCEGRGKSSIKVGIKDVMMKHKEDIVNIYSVAEKPHKLPIRPKWVSNLTLDEVKKRHDSNNILPYLNPLHDQFCDDLEEKLSEEMRKIQKKVNHRFPEASNTYSAERLFVDKKKREMKLLQYSQDLINGRSTSPQRYVATPDWLRPQSIESTSGFWRDESDDDDGEDVNEFDYEQTAAKKNLISRGLASISSSGNTQFSSDLVYTRPPTSHTTPPVECRYPGCGQSFQFAWNLTLHENKEHADPQFKRKFIRKPRLPPGWKKATRERNEKQRAESLFYT